MFSVTKDKELFDTVKQWIERGEDDKVKYILEQTVINDSANTNHETLLHVAAEHHNLSIVEHLLKMGWQIDPKDSYNQTPLNIAVEHKHWAIAKCFLEQNADIFEKYDRGTSPLSVILHNYEPNSEILQMFFDRVKHKCTNKDEFVGILVREFCRLTNVVRLRDAEITEMFMNYPKADLSEPGWINSSIEIAMYSIDEENTRVLLNHTDAFLTYRRRAFLATLRTLLSEYSEDKSLSHAVEVAVKQFVKCQFIDDIQSIILLEMIYQLLPEDSLRPMLTDSVISYIKSALGYDIRMQLFGNVNDCVHQMIQRGEVDKNLIGRKGRSTLHIAVVCGATDNLKYLLDNGMSPNTREENGKTPIFKAHNNGNYSEQCLMMLLERGADLQATDISGKTYLDNYHSPDFSHDLIRIVIAHLAILEVTGVPLKESFRNFVQAFEETLKYFLSCCEQLEKMKTVEVINSTTLFQILTENIEILSKRVKPLPREIFEKFFIPDCTGLQGYDSYYTISVTNRVKRAATLGNLRDTAAVVIADSIEMLKPFDLVIEKIVSFLSYYDLRLFHPRFL